MAMWPFRGPTTTAEQFEIHFGPATRRLWADLMPRKDRPMETHSNVITHDACGGCIRMTDDVPWCARCGDEGDSLGTIHVPPGMFLVNGIHGKPK